MFTPKLSTKTAAKKFSNSFHPIKTIGQRIMASAEQKKLASRRLSHWLENDRRIVRSLSFPARRAVSSLLPAFLPCHSERVRDSPADTWFLGDISRDLERCRMSRQHRQEVCPPSSPCHYKPNPRSERPTPPSSLSPPALFLSCPTLIHRLKWPVSSSITYQPTPPSPQRTSSPAPSSLPPPYLPPN